MSVVAGTRPVGLQSFEIRVLKPEAMVVVAVCRCLLLLLLFEGRSYEAWVRDMIIVMESDPTCPSLFFNALIDHLRTAQEICCVPSRAAKLRTDVK